MYNSEYVPGNLGMNPDDSNFRIYTIHAGDDASNPDWLEWPVDQGAPWVDVDGDGIYDPYVDHPDIIGSMFQWYVMNDGDESAHWNVWGTDPLDVEVQVSMFGFDVPGPLGNSLFMKFKIINSGENQLDSLFVSIWSDPDVGNFSDDFVGCNPEMNLGYAYNDFGGDLIYVDVPPAVGYVYLQTPIVSSSGDTAWVSGQAIPDFKNIDISSFTMYIAGFPDLSDPNTAGEAYNYMNGLIGSTGEPYIDPTTGEPSTFVMNGDPVTGEGWIDYNEFPSGDRRFLLTAGPISMAPSDTQEIITAIVIAQGTDNLNSITELRNAVPIIRSVYETYFEGAGPPVISVSPDTLDFGEDHVGLSDTLKVQVGNIVNEPLHITNITITGDGFTAITDTFSLNIWESHYIDVTFIPLDVLSYTGTISISSSDTANPTVDVVLIGEGVNPPTISVTPDSLYEALYVGDVDSRLITISNEGTSTLDFQIAVDFLSLGQGIQYGQPDLYKTRLSSLIQEKNEDRGRRQSGSWRKINRDNSQSLARLNFLEKAILTDIEVFSDDMESGVGDWTTEVYNVDDLWHLTNTNYNSPVTS